MRIFKKITLALFFISLTLIGVMNLQSKCYGKEKVSTSSKVNLDVDPTGKAYAKVLGTKENKIKTRYLNMLQAVETGHLEKVKHYIDPIRAKNPEKCFLLSIHEARNILILAFNKLANCDEENKNTRLEILIDLIETEVCYSKNEEATPLIKGIIDNSQNLHKDIQLTFCFLVQNLPEDELMRIIEALNKHQVKLDFVFLFGKYGNISLLDYSLLSSKFKVADFLMDNGVNNMEYKQVMEIYVSELLNATSQSDEIKIAEKYWPWIYVYKSTVDEETFRKNVTLFIKFKRAEHAVRVASQRIQQNKK